MGLEDTDLLQRLEDGSLNTLGRVAVVAWSDTSSVLGTVELGKSTDTNVLSEVDVSGNGG